MFLVAMISNTRPFLCKLFSKFGILGSLSWFDHTTSRIRCQELCTRGSVGADYAQ